MMSSCILVSILECDVYSKKSAEKKMHDYNTVIICRFGPGRLFLTSRIGSNPFSTAKNKLHIYNPGSIIPFKYLYDNRPIVKLGCSIHSRFLYLNLCLDSFEQWKDLSNTFIKLDLRQYSIFKHIEYLSYIHFYLNNSFVLILNLINRIRFSKKHSNITYVCTHNTNNLKMFIILQLQ